MNWIALFCLIVGGAWFAWRIWEQGDDWLAAALIIVPLPIVGLFAWYRTGWDETYKAPALMYFGGYALAILVSLLS